MGGSGRAEPSSRAIRLFVSSTFRDMAAEREELVKRVFPQLRKLCETRGVTWGEVDLRWGISDEQQAEGKVLPICLAEIERSRPYFIGLLGERYGWVPQEISEELVEQEPWLKEHLEHSVTELEILHGVLRNPGVAEHAHFYFRDPGYLATIPEEKRGDYTEADPALRAKLADLKERIRRSGFPVREGYPDPRALGRLVLEDFTSLIDRLYPEGSGPDPLDREAAEHEAFARGRAGVYVGCQSSLERLDAHGGGDGPPLVVLGESGSGKSALLANWALRWREAHRDQRVVMHFIGASAASSDWRAMLRRLVAEVARRFDIEVELPDQPDALRAAFAKCLHMASVKGRLVLILDALNQLEDREGALDLVWLPPEMPANVRLVVSTLPGQPLQELARRGWPSLQVQPLERQERGELIERYLARYSKRLDPGRAERIASAPQTANPLYLRALLEELRVFGERQRLDEAIGHYLAADTIDRLFEAILERYEADYQTDRPNLVGEAMSLLWAARRGLSEPELLDLLGTAGGPLPRAVWSPFYLATERSLVNRAGLLGFFHDYLRRAVQSRYLPSEDQQAAAHLRLAGYFARNRLSARAVDELPWQLAEASAWQRLYNLLAEPKFLDAAWQEGAFEIKTGWARVEGSSSLRMVDAYQSVLDHPQSHSPAHLWQVAALLQESGHLEQALVLRSHLVERFRHAGDPANLQASLGNQALILKARGDLDGAMALHQEEERICRQLGDSAGLQRSLGHQALILKDRGDIDGAMALLKEQERICRQLG